MIKIVVDPELILDIGQAYQTGLSYSGVARKLGCGEGTVKAVMKKHYPAARRRKHRKKLTAGTKAEPAEEGLTLASLGLNKAGPCERCGCEIVGYLPGKGGQLCGFCKNPTARFSGAAA